MDKARQAILDMLINMQRNKSFPDRLLKQALPSFSSSQDRSFITRLVYGTVEKRILLDYYISKVSSVKIRKIHIVTLNILRMGLYQILFTNVPPQAACNTSVELARKNGQAKSSGFVNALLRKLANEQTRPSLPSEKEDREFALSVSYSVHPSIVRLLISQYGYDKTKSFLEYAVKSESYTIAVNTVLSSAEKVISALSAEGVVIHNSKNDLLSISFDGALENTAAYKNGWFHVVGAPSYIAAKSLGAKAEEKILDLCAAPGGKTFTIGYAMQGTGQLIAFDVSPKKVDAMQKNATRLGLENVFCCAADTSRPLLKWESKADRVLCDVPCSGLGTIAKKPDIRFRDMDTFSLFDTQLAILQNGANCLRVGGRLVYSTCTINKAENEDVVCRFLKENPNFRIDETVDVDGERGQKLFWPDEKGQDGFYIACLTKIG